MFITLFNSCLLPNSGKSSRITSTSSIKPSTVCRRKGDKFKTLEFYKWKKEFETTMHSFFVLKCAFLICSYRSSIEWRCFIITVTGKVHTNQREL